MTSIDSARFTSFDNARRATAIHTDETSRYKARFPARHGPLFGGLDKIGLSLATLMALGPLAATAWGTYVIGG